MRIGKKGKLSPHYISPFEILDCVRLVAYRFDLPPSTIGKKTISLNGIQCC